MNKQLAVYQWVITYSLGNSIWCKVSELKYNSEEDVRNVEVIPASATVGPLLITQDFIDEEDYIRLVSSGRRPSEYSRQIHHHGGLEGHSFSR
jgi:hypothetical protein